VTYIRTLYDYQKFNFAGPYGENGFLEDYTAGVRGEPIGKRRAGHPQRRRASAAHRGQLPARNTLLLFSRRMGEHFAGTAYGEHFATSALE
jgi:hypothetical protein